MNKKETAAIADIIAAIRAGDSTLNSIERQLLKLCPSAESMAVENMKYALFSPFYDTLTSLILNNECGSGWAMKKDRTIYDRIIKHLHSKKSAEQAAEVFVTYVELAGITQLPLRPDQYQREIFDTKDWKQAKADVAENYGWDLEWLP